VPVREKQRGHEELLELANRERRVQRRVGTIELAQREMQVLHQRAAGAAARVKLGLEHELGAQRGAEQGRELLRERIAAEDRENALAVRAQAHSPPPRARSASAPRRRTARN
jgi:hypothetical protein